MRYPSLVQFTLSTSMVALVCACAAQAPIAPAAATTPAPPAGAPMIDPPHAASKKAPEQGEAKPSADESELLALLPSSKIGLAEGIALAERAGGTAISAKFELENGKLSLSVYTAKAGINADAEHNILAELSGDPTLPVWQTEEEVFADIKHITRASYHLTLVQRSKMGLAAVIAKAQAMHAGQVYAVEPAIHERSPIFHVAIATSGGGHVNIDIESGA